MVSDQPINLILKIEFKPLGSGFYSFKIYIKVYIEIENSLFIDWSLITIVLDLFKIFVM